MSGSFAGYEIVAQTKNFLITCEDDSEARLRAAYVAQACESDLSQLNNLFSTNFEAGVTSEHGVWVNVLKNDPSSAANGWNFGYEEDESSRIILQRAFIPPPPQPPPADPPPVTPPNYANAVIEFPRFVFVAEMAEILMEFSGYGWHLNNSMGEGLSNLLGTLLHPAGYYDTGQGPRINSWLNASGPPRPDFISNTEATDQNQISYGCSILFINYLVNQLGFPLKDVIRAGGGTLAETYGTLTGKPQGSAYSTFTALLQQHIGNVTTNNMARDNIFPLYDPNHRKVTLTLGDEINKGEKTDPSPVSFRVKPGLLCPTASFEFFRHEEQLEQPVYARAIGTANASFRWMIEGVEVSVRNQITNLTISSPVTVKNPDGSTESVSGSVNIQYGILDSWNGSVLYLKTVSTDGNCSLKIDVLAREAAVNDAEVSATDEVGLMTVSWLPGDEIKKASKRCNPFYAAIDKSIWGLSAALSDFKNRPDPPSERSIRKIAELVHTLDDAVKSYAHAGGLTVAEVWKRIGTPNGLRSSYPLPAEIDLSRLRPKELPRGTNAPAQSDRASGQESSTAKKGRRS